jgi:hypothetical protein
MAAATRQRRARAFGDRSGGVVEGIIEIIT